MNERTITNGPNDMTISGMTVLAVGPDAVYLRIPRELQRPCQGCDCPYCKSHPDETPSWDALCVPTQPKRNDHAHTVHMPDPRPCINHWRAKGIKQPWEVKSAK